MESSEPSPDQAVALLAAADRSRARMAADVRLPRGHEPAMGVAIAVQIATAAVGLTTDAGWGAPVALLGAAGFAVVAAVQLARFRRLNGVWLGGFAGKVVFGTATAASVAYAVGLVGALAAAGQERWWLVGVFAVAGAVGYVAGGRRWMARYRRDPAAHAPGESVRWLLAMTAVVVAGSVLLVLNG